MNKKSPGEEIKSPSALLAKIYLSGSDMYDRYGREVF
jgi:hypothetical protein